MPRKPRRKPDRLITPDSFNNFAFDVETELGALRDLLEDFEAQNPGVRDVYTEPGMHSLGRLFRPISFELDATTADVIYYPGDIAFYIRQEDLR